MGEGHIWLHKDEKKTYQVMGEGHIWYVRMRKIYQVTSPTTHPVTTLTLYTQWNVRMR